MFEQRQGGPFASQRPSSLERREARDFSSFMLRGALLGRDIHALRKRRVRAINHSANLPFSIKLKSRSPFAYAGPQRVSSPPPNAQDQENKKGVDRVNQAQNDMKDQAAKDITKAHDDATTKIDQANKGEIDYAKKLVEAEAYATAHPGDKAAHNVLISAQNNYQTANKNGEWSKKYAAYHEKDKDTQTLKNFGEQSTNKMTTEFNSNGDAKSDKQKALDKAKKGFMQFLDVFTDLIGDLGMMFPALGEVIQVGIQLEKFGTKVADGIKAAKAAKKADKIGEKIKKVLDINGPQVIGGVSGKEMDEMQKKLIGELVGMVSKNEKATDKMVEDTTLKGYKAPSGGGRGKVQSLSLLLL
ncbi:hypothetical protein MMC19_000456 [Ptychographa xylographoides]|nr:hypothetical protein [Ptychographa xylographoides]